MARIRSIHPALFTDDAFMSLSMAARVLLVGIWTEADDNGIFEWKPITIKARILPADNVDTVALLAELERGDFVNRFSSAAATYGAIRNFAKFQRPKFPKARHIIPGDLRNYVGLKPSATEALPQDIPKPTPIPPQMEDGGGRMEKKDDGAGDARASPGCAISPEAFALSDDLMRLQRLETDDPRCIAASYAVQAWLTKGWKADIIRSTVDIVMSKRAEAPSALRYFEKAIAAAHAEQNRPLPIAIIREESPHVVRKNARPRGALDAIRDIQRQLEDGADSEADQYPAVGLSPG